MKTTEVWCSGHPLFRLKRCYDLHKVSLNWKGVTDKQNNWLDKNIPQFFLFLYFYIKVKSEDHKNTVLCVFLGIEFYIFVSHSGMKDRGSTPKYCNAQHVNFVMHKVLFEIYTWILCISYHYEKQISIIQSLCLYFIKIVLFWPWNIRF